MEDYPAGTASSGAWRAPLSVVIPVRNGGCDFERCLQALRNSSWKKFELIVVDDGSVDGSGELAAKHGAIVVRHDQPRGPAAARNTGARAATSPLVFFLDADVLVHPETIGRAAARMQAEPGLTAIFGSYDDVPDASGMVSRFRNLLHHYVHQRGDFEDDARLAHTFWTGCGVIRRETFLEMGGFDPTLYRRPAIEDIELGYRLARSGHHVLLVRNLLVTHLKRWSLWEMIRTDIFQRGVPWSLLILRSRMAENDLNVSSGQRLCVLSTGLAMLGPLLAIFFGHPGWLGLTAAGIAVNLDVNRPFYRFLHARLGMVGVLAAIPLHTVYFLCCGISVAIALGLWTCSSRIRAGGPIVPESSARTRSDRAEVAAGTPHARPGSRIRRTLRSAMTGSSRKDR